MKPNPLVSLVVPMHNRATLIERCLDSILAQDYTPIEVLLVDNASTDATRQVAARWIAHHETEARRKGCRFLLLDEAEAGATHARYRGLLASQGEWVAFFDDDDEFSPHFFSKMLAALRQAPTARWALARTLMVFADGSEQLRHGWPLPTLADHLLASLVSTQSFVAQRSLLLEIDAWRPHLRLWNDYYLGALLLLHAPQPAWCEGVFHRIYQHADSLTGTGFARKSHDLSRTLSTLRNTLEKAAQTPTLPLQKIRAAQCALYLRTQWVVGRLRYEGEKVEAKTFSKSLFPSHKALNRGFFPLWIRLVGAFLQRYTAWGGRGVWRMARWCCHWV